MKNIMRDGKSWKINFGALLFLRGTFSRIFDNKVTTMDEISASLDSYLIDFIPFIECPDKKGSELVMTFRCSLLGSIIDLGNEKD